MEGCHVNGTSGLGEYEVTEEDAERLNAASARSHSDIKPGEKFPAITSRVTPIYKHAEDEDGNPKRKKVGELHHVHVFFPDGVQVLQFSKENPKEEPRPEPVKEEGDDE